MDQEDICRRLPEVCKSDTHLTLWHYGRQFAVNRKDDVISALSDNKPVDVMPQLNIYTLFWYASTAAQLTGEWMLAFYRSISERHPYPFGRYVCR